MEILFYYNKIKISISVPEEAPFMACIKYVAEEVINNI
jgi:hypothetical protein